MSVIKRRSLQEKDELERLLESTRRYYEAYSVEYVKFYDDGFRSEGAFFNHEYREGYDKIAELLRNLAKPQELVIDVGCGVGFWSALMAEYGDCVVSLDQLSGLLQKCGERSERLKLESKILRILADGFFIFPLEAALLMVQLLTGCSPTYQLRATRHFYERLGGF